jgi:hypothetical protein
MNLTDFHAVTEVSQLGISHGWSDTTDPTSFVSLAIVIPDSRNTIDVRL